MFGFHSFSEKPFSAPAVTAAAAIHGGEAALQVSATLTAGANLESTGSKNLEANGTIQAAGSVIKTGTSSLSSTATITASDSRVTKGASLLVDGGTVSSNGTLLIPNELEISSSASITANAKIFTTNSSSLSSSGTVTSSPSLIVSPDLNISTSGNITNKPSLQTVGKFDVSGSGAVSANSSSLALGSSSLSSSGEITGVIGKALSGSSELSCSGSLTADGQKFLTTTSIILNAGTVTSSANLIMTPTRNAGGYSGVLIQTQLSASSTVSTVGPTATKITGKSSILGSGTVTASLTGSQLLKSSIGASGSLSSDVHTIVGIDSSLSTNSTVSGTGTTYKSISAGISGSGTVGTTPTNLLSGKSLLEGLGSVLAGQFNPIELLGVSTLRGQIGYRLDSQATIGTSFGKCYRQTKKLDYKTSLPKLSHLDKGIGLDFPFHEGAGNLHSVSSRRQVGNTNNLIWGRVDGRQALTSNGGNYNGYRASFDTDGLNFDTSTIVVSFKPTFNAGGYQFLFNNRGGSNNNNEIDCYSLNTSSKVRIDIYNGSTKQTLDVPGLIFNEWNTLVVSWGTDLKASLNGGNFTTYSSITMPSVINKTFYLMSNADDRYGMQGSIDHFRFYNRELSNIQAKELYRNINKDYTISDLAFHDYEMSKLGAAATIVKDGKSDIISNTAISAYGSFLVGSLKSSFGGLAEILADGESDVAELDISSASLSATATFLANGILLGELDIVPFTLFINRLENYDQNIYQNFVKEMNIARSKIITASIDQQKTNTINIDKILEKTLEK